MNSFCTLFFHIKIASTTLPSCLDNDCMICNCHLLHLLSSMPIFLVNSTAASVSGYEGNSFNTISTLLSPSSRMYKARISPECTLPVILRVASSSPSSFLPSFTLPLFVAAWIRNNSREISSVDTVFSING